MQIPNSPDWGWTKHALHQRGMTFSAIAKRLDVHLSIVCRVKSQTNYRSQAMIADIIGCKPEQLWPDRYPQGKPYIFDNSKWGSPTSPKSDAGADNRSAA